MSFFLRFVSDQSLEFIVEKSPDLPKGSAHTVDIAIEPLGDELYLVSWQEATGNGPTRCARAIARSAARHFEASTRLRAPAAQWMPLHLRP